MDGLLVGKRRQGVGIRDARLVAGVRWSLASMTLWFAPVLGRVFRNPRERSLRRMAVVRAAMYQPTDRRAIGLIAVLI